MLFKGISYEEISQFSDRDKAYQRGDERLQEFIQYSFLENERDKLIDNRKKYPVNRKLLTEQVKAQYLDTDYYNHIKENCEALISENCFTVTTAHQPSLMMGPLYYIYKICSAIHLSKKWSTNEHKIVPIFILGAEDHDFEEINHLYLFNKRIEWKTDQSGATGRMSKTGLEEAIIQVSDILGGSENAEDLKSKLAYAQSHSDTYGSFMFHLINQIFSRYGLIVMNFDNKEFKKAFSPLIKKELFSNFSKPLVRSTQQALASKGFKNQAFSRDINLFYLSDNSRNRIEFENGKYEVLDSNFSFTEEEILAEVENHPENFSPNVVMRPLYQETILPNLAYIGGGGELAYWMERKSQFSEAGVFYPMLIRRKSAMWITKNVSKALSKLNLKFEDLLIENDQLVKKFALDSSEHSVEFKEEYKVIDDVYKSISDKAGQIDNSLIGKLEAMKTNHLKALEKIQTRLVRAIKQNHEVQTNKILKTKEQLFPNNGLQERRSNFMEIYLNHGQEMIDILIEKCDPFDKDMLLVYEE